MHHVIGNLKRLQRRSRLLLIVQRASLVVACLLAAMLLLIGIDWLMRLPSGVRLVQLIGLLIVLGLIAATYLRSAVTFQPTLTQIALRAERLMPALSGRLASSMEFVRDGVDVGNPLAARSVQETEARLAGDALGRVMRPARTGQFGGLLLLAVLLCATITVATPQGMQTGMQRLLLPMSSAAWPARTGVESRMHEVFAVVHPRGETLALRAQVTRGADDQRVYAQYRMQVDGRYLPWRQILLTHQSSGLHERLIDAEAEAIELFFQTDDDQTATERIEVIEPPAVMRAELHIEPPDYAIPYVPNFAAELGPGTDARAVTDAASLLGSRVALTLHLNKSLPVPAFNDAQSTAAWLHTTFGWPADAAMPAFSVDSTDERVWQLTWTLDGSRDLDLHLRDQYRLTSPETITYRILSRVDQRPSVTITEPQSDEIVLPNALVPLTTEAQDDVALRTLAFQAELTPAVADRSTAEEQVEQQAGLIWQSELDAIHAAVGSHAVDLDLSRFDLAAGDVITVTALATDVYDLDGTQHEAVRSAPRRLRVISDLEYASQLRRRLSAVRQNAIRIETLQAELQDDLIESGVQPGVERAQAQLGQRIADQRDELDELARAMQRNRLEDPQLDEVLQQARELVDYAGRFAGQASEAIEQRMNEMAADRAREREATKGEAPDQARGDDAADSDRPDTDGDTAAEQQARAGGDGTDAQAGDQAGQRGADQQANAGDSDADGDQQPDGAMPDAPQFAEAAAEDQPIVDAQQQVRDELSDLIELLDRDEDTWVITRQIEDLIDQQARLERRTQDLGNETIGRTPEELTEAQSNELERIAERQRELSEELRNLIDEARDRAEGLEDVDQSAASGLRTAADTAEQREIDREMERAAEQAEQNQRQSARQSQQSARESMERMLEDIEQTNRARAQELLRQLASLIESIQRLVTVQENELIALAQGQARGDFSDRDRAMIRLNQNTLVVASEARAAGQRSRRIARSLDRAADAQGAAVVALRAVPVNVADAELAENRSLELLNEALELAEELEQQVEEDELRRRREELLAAYRQAIEVQTVLRDETLELAEQLPLDRRELVQARRVGSTQDDVRSALDRLRAETTELMDSPTFSMVHRLIDRWSRQVTEQLTQGEVGVDVTDRQLRIADSIGRLIDVLEEAMMPPNEFVQDGQQQQQDGGGEGGEGGQPGEDDLIPVLAELRLLRGMQEQIYDQTRSVDSRADLDDSQRRQRLRELGEQQRELLHLGTEMLDQLRDAMNQQGRPVGPPDGGMQP